MLTNVYIDGFNLYYRALKETPFKWLNLRNLAEVLFPEYTIQKVSYFTALITARPNDPIQPQRQQTFLRALQTLPDFEIHYGTFRPRTKIRPLASPVPGLPKYVKILDTEERGSDVNLATRMLADGFNGIYERAVVVSNDSDLATPIRYVRDNLGIPVTVVNPDERINAQGDIQSAATNIRRLRKSHLRLSQFPPTVFDAQGPITKPKKW